MDRCKTIKNIRDGIIDFIDTKNTYESSTAIDDTIKSIDAAKDLESIFRIPIENRLFNFNSSMEWLFFICVAIKTIKDESIILPDNFNINFSVEDAMMYLQNIYNNKKEDLEEYFDYSEEED
jgi:hypothetical protein